MGADEEDFHHSSLRALAEGYAEEVLRLQQENSGLKDQLRRAVFAAREERQMNMFTNIKAKLPAIMTVLAIIGVTFVLKTVGKNHPEYHEGLEYMLSSLGVIGAVAVRALFGDSAPKVDKALGLPEEDDKKAVSQ